MNVTTLRRAAALTAFATLAAAGLTGCAADAAGSSAPPSPTTQASQVTVVDPWVRSADTGMSAAFGSVQNTGDAPVHLVAATSPATTEAQLHETVDTNGTMQMQQKDGGFTIAGGETLTLAPGGDHIMLMDLTAPLAAGDEVALTLTFEDDSTLEVTAPVKDYAGGDENYVDGSMDMSE